MLHCLHYSSFFCLLMQCCESRGEKTALNQIAKLKTPTEGEARLLSKLFNSSQTVLPASRRAFDPAEELVVKEAKRRQKSTSVEPSKVEVCLLPHYMAQLPRGKARVQLNEKGRLKKISVKRSDTWPTIHNAITATFGELYSGMAAPTILCCNGTALSKADNQTPGGDAVIDRRGSFYLSDGAPEDPICLMVCAML